MPDTELNHSSYTGRIYFHTLIVLISELSFRTNALSQDICLDRQMAAKLGQSFLGGKAKVAFPRVRCRGLKQAEDRGIELRILIQDIIKEMCQLVDLHGQPVGYGDW